MTQAHNKLKSKEITSQELVQSCIDRIEKVDGSLNAVVHKNFDGALEQAKRIDAAGKFDHPLTGIPFLAKDVYCEEGIPTTACSNVLRDKDYVPTFDSTTIGRLKNAGAISIGKTNTDEFTCGASCETSCYGPCKNPWDTTRVSGGSSGGSAAGVAADECIFAIGTDTGGSIREPAAWCGVTGMRSTYGRTSRYGVMSMASSFDTIGALTKNTEDLSIVLGTIAGKDPLDPTTGDVAVPDFTQSLGKDIKGMKVGLPKEYFTEGVKPDVEEAVRTAVKQLENLGAVVSEISLPHTKYAVPCYYVLVPCEVSSNMARYDGIRYGHTVKNPDDLIDYYHKTRTEGFGDELKRRIMIGTYALSAGYYDAYYRHAQKVRTLFRKDFEEAFAKVDVIVSPTTPHPAYVIGQNDNDPVAMYLEDIFVAPQTLAGIPAISVPCGFSTEGMPLGLQIMGPQWGEETIFKVAHAYEQATDWNERRPSI
ncbi:MAG: Asp-tRNA(Asn)/Glu-tRNA(Gln) amidotransferase subunit GatA [Candidatus Peribacteraceae bacterium]|nr:Asp-tRNA(Asn)/Glu-tRNA(Gln) amidotransferase subunit GatA [Candidatus Peribacteraceae bacterium]